MPATSLKSEIRNRNAAANAAHEASRNIRNIGPIDPPLNAERRIRGQHDFKYFCEEYFPEVFYLDWSEDQLRCIDKIEEVILDGALFALAMPRGSGKTALCQTAVIWAQAYGHRRYIYFLGDDQESSEDSLLSIKTEWEANAKLAEDFPEICVPLIKAEGITSRFRGQLCYDRRVQCVWVSDRIVLPSIMFNEATYEWKRWLEPVRTENDRWLSLNAGIITRTKGITGGIRGAIFKHPVTGELLRPDLFIADDIQTDQVAESPSQISKITRYLEAAVQGLAGPGEVISGIMPCTVIQQGDISDTFLDRKVKPRWKGERCSMVTRWPDGLTDNEITDETEEGRLWNEYARIWLDSLQQEGDIAQATAFYAQNREVMDRNFEVSWTDRYNKDEKLKGNVEISAQQHAMNLRLDNPSTFASEYQNKPLSLMATNADVLSPIQIAKRVSDIKRYQVPSWCEIITSFIDIQDEVLFYGTLAVSPDYTGVILDYNTFPEFPSRYFTKTQTETWAQLSRHYFKANGKNVGEERVKAPFEAKIHYGLEQVTGMLLKAKYRRDDGTEMPINRIGIDANWGKTTDLVKRFCRYQTDPRLTPMHGRFVGATTKPFDEWQKREGWLFEDQIHKGIEKVSWVIPASTTGVRHVLVDTNFYKTFFHHRLAAPLGSSGSIVLFNGTPLEHEMFSQHTGGSERPTPVTAKGRTIDEWKELPSRLDNDYFDCMVGCLCLASIEGACLKALGKVSYAGKNKPRRKLSELWKKKRSMQ